MKIPRYRGIVLTSALFLGLTQTHCAGKTGNGSKKVNKESSMTQSETPIPFGLTLEQSKVLKIQLTLYSPKTGAGKQQIEVSGSGQIRLIRTANNEAPEEVVVGKVSEENARALFILIESEGFLKMQDDYKSGVISGRKHLLLTLPDREKSVYADYASSPPEFDQIFGGIKLVAGIGAPLSIGHGFLFGL